MESLCADCTLEKDQMRDIMLNIDVKQLLQIYMGILEQIYMENLIKGADFLIYHFIHKWTRIKF